MPCLRIAACVLIAACAYPTRVATAGPWSLRLVGEAVRAEVPERGRPFDADSDAVGLRIGWALRPWLQLEAGYWDAARDAGGRDLQSSSARSYRIDVSGWTFGLRPVWKLGNAFIAPRLGVVRWKADSSTYSAASRQSLLFLSWDEGSEAYLGLDLGYRIAAHWTVFATATRFRMQAEQDGREIEQTSLGAGVGFAF